MEDACSVSFALGMALDRYYFDSLYGAVLPVGGLEGRLLARLVGVRVDLVNLYWIYRCRRFFSLSPEQALATVTRSRYRADFGLLSRAAFSELSAWDDVLEGTPCAGIFRSDEADPSFFFVLYSLAFNFSYSRHFSRFFSLYAFEYSL